MPKELKKVLLKSKLRQQIKTYKIYVCVCVCVSI